MQQTEYHIMRLNNAVYLAWRSPNPAAGWKPIGRLWKDSNYKFAYTKGADDVTCPKLPGMDDIHSVYESKKLFPVFENRLLNSRRSEYTRYLEWSGFGINDIPDPIAILAVTEGRRNTDFYEVFPCPVKLESNTFNFRFFLHGIEYLDKKSQERINSATESETLLSMLDFQNEYDENAVALRTKDDRKIVGYLPRYINREAIELYFYCMTLDTKVVRVNKDAPLQFRVLCDLTACWPEDYRPFSSEYFQLINSSVPVSCNELS